MLLLEIRLKLILLSRSFQCVTFACDHVMVGCPYLKYSQLRRWAIVDGRLGGRGRIIYIYIFFNKHSGLNLFSTTTVSIFHG